MLSRRALLAGMGAAPFALIEPGFAQLAGNAFIVSGFPAGGMGDLVSRPLAEKLRGTYAGNMLVESKVGAGGRIAAEFVKRANPDGLTILQIPSSVMVLYPHIYQNLAYDPFADFAPVTMTTTYSFSFTASAALPDSVRTVSDFVTWAKANPGKSSFGIPATGSALHFAGMMLQRAADIPFTAVPYRGGGPLLTDMLSGVIPVSFNVLGEVLPHIKSGKLRALAVCSPERSKFLPDVATMREQGFADIALTEWLGWFLPSKTPADLVNRLNGLVREGLRSPELVARLAESALEPNHQSPEEFATMMRRDYEKWSEIAKATDFKIVE
jgi:tripartite-type tricarboxylate transporter receptor subunit TctC